MHITVQGSVNVSKHPVLTAHHSPYGRTNAQRAWLKVGQKKGGKKRKRQYCFGSVDDWKFRKEFRKPSRTVCKVMNSLAHSDGS